ncbi:MAG: hypothetical protein QNJ22_15950 [Desulfosarcinaceae bacterium]|nr:hypothetical protein [Desulfosarcinaceae bacterium]
MFTTSVKHPAAGSGEIFNYQIDLGEPNRLGQATTTFTEACLAIACQHFGVLGATIEAHGHQSLSAYLSAIAPSPIGTFQPVADLLDIVHTQVKSLFGAATARQSASDLERSPLVLTANHHGVTYFTQDFQGNLILALNRMGDDDALHTVPVFACGTVPLDNLTYPLGLLCYDTQADAPHDSPKKIPVFSNKMRRQMVSCAKPFDPAMVGRAQQRAQKLIGEGAISATLDRAIQTILKRDYSHPDVADLPSYTLQSTALNHRIWGRLFNTNRRTPELITLELEKVAIGLLEKDLINSDSLAHCVMFDAKLRQHVFNMLDGQRACWRSQFLLRRLHADQATANNWASAAGCGTMLFWGLDDRGRRVPLYLRNVGTGRALLCGIDDRGKLLEMPFTVQSILEGLQNDQLLPSIFTSLLAISLARGVVCAGGYFQCEYLPTMQRGLVKALKATGGYSDAAARVAQVKTDTYLSGMIAVMRSTEAGHLIPAGPLEIMAGGGLDDDALERMRALTVRDAHIGAMGETIQDLPNEEKERLPVDWHSKLVKDAKHLLSETISVV